jgi:hypothetical protein
MICNPKFCASREILFCLLGPNPVQLASHQIVPGWQPVRLRSRLIPNSSRAFHSPQDVNPPHCFMPWAGTQYKGEGTSATTFSGVFSGGVHFHVGASLSHPHCRIAPERRWRTIYVFSTPQSHRQIARAACAFPTTLTTVSLPYLPSVTFLRSQAIWAQDCQRLKICKSFWSGCVSA